MDAEIKKIDYSFAYEVQTAETPEEVVLALEHALHRFGLKETARQMKKKLIK